MSLRHALPWLLVLVAAAGAACGSAEAGKKKDGPPVGTAVGERLAAFKASGTRFAADGTPTAVQLDSRRQARPTAYVFVGTGCPTTARYVERLAGLEQQFAGKLDWVFLYPNKTDSTEQKVAFHKAGKLAGPMIDDQGARLATVFGAQRTAEAVLVGKDGVIVYRGAIDDNKDAAAVTRKHLAIAAEEHLAGKPVSEPKTPVSA